MATETRGKRERLQGRVFVSMGDYRVIDCEVEYRREGRVGSAYEHDERPLYRYGVYAKGKRLGHVQATESESRNRRVRHLAVHGHSIRWLASTKSHRIKFSTRREAAIQLLADTLPRRKGPRAGA
jgi:sporulation protein YlmC with PRC-barrel domain